MIKNVFMEVLPDVWPMLIIITVILSSLRIAYLICRHKKFQLHKEMIYLISIIYILNPSYFAPLFSSTLGYMIIVTIVLMFIIYVILLNKITKIDV